VTSGDDSFLDHRAHEDVAAALDTLIRAVSDPTQPASSYGELEQLLGTQFGVDVTRVYAAWVSKPARRLNCLG
jgi:hypothetical protein